MGRKRLAMFGGALLIVLLAVYLAREPSREGLEEKDTYRVNMIAPNTAQYGKKDMVYQPSNITPDVAFPSDWTGRMARAPIRALPNADEFSERDPADSKDMGWIADPGKFVVKYDCRPSLTGVYEDCGPYSWNIGDYGNKLTGCECPLMNEHT